MKLAFLESRRNYHRAWCDTEVRVNTAERVRVRAMLNGDYLLFKNLSVFIAILASFVNFLLPSSRVRGGLGWGKKFTTPARIAIYGKCFTNGLAVVLKCAV